MDGFQQPEATNLRYQRCLDSTPLIRSLALFFLESALHMGHGNSKIIELERNMVNFSLCKILSIYERKMSKELYFSALLYYLIDIIFNLLKINFKIIAYM